MPEVEPESVDLLVTSSPYGIGIEYGTSPGQLEVLVDSWSSYERFLSGICSVFSESYTKVKPGGFLAINVAPTHTHAVDTHFDSASMLPTTERLVNFFTQKLGATYRWRYTWRARRTRNSSSGAPTTYLGSYGLLDPETGEHYGLPLKGQVLREIEDILIFQKGPLIITEEREARRRDPRSRISKERWELDFSQVMDFPGESTGDHPAVFPIELPKRMIEAYSCWDDLILDPFAGRGTTLLAARELGRRAVGFEVEERFEPVLRASGLFQPELQQVWG